ncbi:MAG TPA: AgmX/PglI C-terminal domain-containing protein, partial [Fredinandcohnia sp.]|nr:AgmX/PglI C-terminal domain-containing protein [Fredinandcohnia sp.]
VGAIGTRGRGGGSSNFGAGVGGLGAKGSAEVKIDTSAVSITGTIDRELIRRVIQANHGKFRYCYENELVRNPRLSGRIAVRFQIDAQGKVTFANVASTTMNNAAVENCVVARIRGLTFPMPQGGGVALVTYPFLFTPPGE